MRDRDLTQLRQIIRDQVTLSRVHRKHQATREASWEAAKHRGAEIRAERAADREQTRTQPPPCPGCGGVMAKIIYGMVTGPVRFDGPYVLAGCCKPVPAPTARCEPCGHEVFENEGA